MNTVNPLQRRIDAAQGRIPCDLILKGVKYLDVFSCEWRPGDLSVVDGVCVGVEPGLKGAREIDARNRWVVPGFIDAHVHVESSCLVPTHFESAVLPRGTTSAICDPHELANVQGVRGIEYFLEASSRMTMDLRVMLSSCVPATHLETNGGGVIGASDLAPLATHPRALGLAEVMNMPGVLNGDPEVLAKLTAFAARPIDGHCPLLRGRELSAYAAAGISSCHESSELEEAREKLSKGIAVWIREGSVAKDLHTLLPLLNLATSTTVGFCTDDRNPLDILTEGHVDHLVRVAIREGVAPEVAYRSASWAVARHYGLDRGPSRVGAVAPGYGADWVMLSDPRSCEIADVFKRGNRVGEFELGKGAGASLKEVNSIRASVPQLADLQAPQGRVRVIGVIPGKIISESLVMDSADPSVARLTVLERYGRGQKPANAYVKGFGSGFKGAIASSVGHDSHNLIVVGKNPEDMRVALASLIECGGGFCVVDQGRVAARLALPLGGLMSQEDPAALWTQLSELKAASRAIGCELDEPFLQLAFLSLPVIPSLKLTDRGLVDVNAFNFVSVAV